MSAEDINKVLSVFGVELSVEESEALMAESDKNKDGMLNLKEFIEVVKYGEGFVKKNGIPQGLLGD